MVDGPNSGATSVFSDASASSSVNLMIIQLIVQLVNPIPETRSSRRRGAIGQCSKKRVQSLSRSIRQSCSQFRRGRSGASREEAGAVREQARGCAFVGSAWLSAGSQNMKPGKIPQGYIGGTRYSMAHVLFRAIVYAA
jgi:hypothetical protein